MRGLSIVALVIVLVAVARIQAASVFQPNKSLLVHKPQCGYKYKGCFDIHQQRFEALIPKAGQAFAERQAFCRPATKCPVVKGPATLAAKPSSVVRPHNQLTFLGDGFKSYNGKKVEFRSGASFNLLTTGLTLTNSALIYPRRPDAFFTAANGSLSITNTVIRGALKLFHTSYASFAQVVSNVNVTDTTVRVDYSRWTLTNSRFTVNWRSTVAPRPPGYVGSYPTIFARSYIQLKNSVMRFHNVQDAFFAYTTIVADGSRIVMENSNVRFIDCVFVLTNSYIVTNNASLVLHHTEFRTDQYVSAVTGVKGLPAVTKAPYPSINKFAFVGRGTGTIKLVAKPK